MMWKTFAPSPALACQNVTCFRCNRKGHFSSQCLSKTMGELTTPLYQQTDEDLPDDDPYSDAVFLSADAVYVDAVHNSLTQWNISVTVRAHPVVFKVDTGAEVTALSEKTYDLLHESVPQLQKSTHKLCRANRVPLDVLGVTKMKLIYNSKSTTQEVFVIRDLQQPFGATSYWRS